MNGSFYIVRQTIYQLLLRGKNIYECDFESLKCSEKTRFFNFMIFWDEAKDPERNSHSNLSNLTENQISNFKLILKKS